MDNNTILITILGSTLLSAIVSGIIAIINSQRMKAIELEYDYKRSILDRRKEAYLVLEKAIGAAIRSFPILNKSEINTERLKKRITESKQCRTDLAKPTDYAVWLSIAMLQHVTSLITTLEKYELDLGEIIKKEYVEKELVELQESIALREWAIEVLLTHHFMGDFLKDLVDLGNIKKFIKERKRSMEIIKPQ